MNPMNIQIDKGQLKLVYVDPLTLQDNPSNWHVHTEEQGNALQGVLYAEDGVGWAGALLVNLRADEDGWNGEQPVLLDGHERKRLAIKNKEQSVPVLVGRWTREEERKVLATLDPIGAMALTDHEKFAQLVDGIATDVLGDSGLNDLVDGLAEELGLDLPQPLQEEREGIEVAQGDLWEIGPHRILCGNALNGDDVRRVMGNRRVDLAFVDPPKGIDNALSALALIWWAEHNTCYAVDVERDALVEMGMYVAQRLIWQSKDALEKLDYARRHREILFAWQDKHFFYGEVGTSTVFKGEWKRMVAQLVCNSTERDALVYMPYCGSGEELAAIAAEERTVVGVELNARRASEAVMAIARTGEWTPKRMEQELK